MPSIVSSPAVGGSISVTRRASVLLPQPDSPTTASGPAFDQLEARAAQRLKHGRAPEHAAAHGI